MSSIKIATLLFSVSFLLCACQSSGVNPSSQNKEEVPATYQLSSVHEMNYEYATKLLALYDSGNPWAKKILNAIAQENGAYGSTYENGVVYFVSQKGKNPVDMNMWMPYADQWMEKFVFELKRRLQQNQQPQKINKQRTRSPVCKAAYAKAMLQGAFNSVPTFCWDEDMERALCPAAEKAAILTGNFSAIPNRCIKYLR